MYTYMITNEQKELNVLSCVLWINRDPKTDQHFKSGPKFCTTVNQMV
jgi:hypothetical protein